MLWQLKPLKIFPSADIDGAATHDSSLSSSTHVLPVSSIAELETINTLDKGTQAVLRKGTYSFVRCATAIAPWQFCVQLLIYKRYLA